VTQVDQVILVSDLEQKTERSMTPCLITTEPLIVKPNSLINILKDKDLANLSTRRYNIGPLNMQVAVQAMPSNEEQIETDRMLIQQIIYQNQIPSNELSQNR